MIVSRPKLGFLDKIYFPAILGGMLITLRHLIKTWKRLIFKKEIKPEERTLMDMSSTGMVTMQYPEEKWPLPPGYRGAPTLVKDEDDRTKCVSCQLCEFICPPRAIRITPGDIPADSVHAKVEKAPKAFDIDMLRCIYCGLCEEVCPEEAIYLKDEYALVGTNRDEMVNHKDKLLEMGGVTPRPIKKWENK
ncbi:MAG: NADH-quinone oxidoreductase subunit I [Verrucomicrobiota bacterium]